MKSQTIRKNNPVLCGVIGNPIEHSFSPDIHRTFAQQQSIELEYNKHLLETSSLNSFIDQFFYSGGTGLNVTLPFKQQVIESVDCLSEAAARCRSVNTLLTTENGQVYGDTTDGAGLLLDLNRLGFQFKNKNVLVIGAGGASISVIDSLLMNNTKITLHNRTSTRIDNVIEQFSPIGKITPFNPSNDTLFDGVICATSQFNQELVDPIVSFLRKDSFIYDLNYSQRSKKNLAYFSARGFNNSSDGYGMLLGQAAKSFELWHGVLPDIFPLLSQSKSS